MKCKRCSRNIPKIINDYFNEWGYCSEYCWHETVNNFMNCEDNVGGKK